MNFLRKLSAFVAVLANARASIADAEELSPCAHSGLTSVTTPADILAAAANPDLVEAAEACTLTWCKEIHQILTKSEQMRRESDNVGPQAELEHWKKRMAKFDSLTSSIKSPQCRAIINILVAAKSKVLQVKALSHIFMCGDPSPLPPFLPDSLLSPSSLPSLPPSPLLPSLLPPSSLPSHPSPSLPPPSLPLSSLPSLPPPSLPPSLPPCVQTWKDLDITITDYTNEAKDNVKFLYTLERYCEPLYNCNPVSAQQSGLGPGLGLRARARAES